MHLIAHKAREDNAVVVPDQVELFPLLGFMSVAAFLCAGMYFSVLEYIDSLLLYMTIWEVMLEAGVALLLLLGLSAAWWLCGLLMAGILRIFPWTKRHSTWLCWWLWLSFPFAYFSLELLTAIRLRIFPNWLPGTLASFTSALGLMLICAGALFIFGFSKVQEFCRTRLAPIGFVQVILGIIMAIALWAHGVHPFRDFIGPNRAFAGVRPPDIYLITFDALRAEDMSVYGYGRPTTPDLERFAQRSFIFENFIANSNLTTPTTTSIETGKLPWSHRLFQLGGFLRDSRQETLAGLLRQRGYYTAMISANLYASPFCHATQEDYDAVEFAAPLGVGGLWNLNPAGMDGQGTIFLTFLRRLGSLGGFLDRLFGHRYPLQAEGVFARAQSLLQSRGNAQPMFIWTHIFPPHDPYWPPAPYRMKFAQRQGFVQIRGNRLPSGWTAPELRAQYDEMILYADHVVGDYLDWLDRTGRLNQAIVVVTADHGESFEHGWFLHGGPSLHSGLIHIPLFIHLPDQQRSESISQPAQQVDLLPTLLDLIGAPLPNWTDGTSLRPVLEGRTLSQRYVFSMVLESDSVFHPISRASLSIMDDEFKYLMHLDNQKQMLYRYKTDPSELHDLSQSDPEVARRMHDLLLAKVGKANERFSPGR